MRALRRSLCVWLGLALFFATAAPALARPTGQSASSSGATLVTPGDWFESDNGKVVAASEEDLGADVPSGPRARILKVKHPKKKAKSGALVKGIGAEAESDSELVDGPTASTFGDVSATVVTFLVTVDGARLIQRYVFLAPTNGKAAVIVLEAPEDQFAAAESTLMSTLNAT